MQVITFAKVARSLSQSLPREEAAEESRVSAVVCGKLMSITQLAAAEFIHRKLYRELEQSDSLINTHKFVQKPRRAAGQKFPRACIPTCTDSSGEHRGTDFSVRKSEGTQILASLV